MRRRISVLTIVLALGLCTAVQAQNKPGNFEVVAGPIAEKITNNSAEVWYALGKPTDTLVRYGIDPNVMALHAPAEKEAGERNYKVTLNNLRPNTTYYIAVARPNGTIIDRASFRTQPANFNG